MLCEVHAILLSLFVKIGLILSVNTFYTCTKYHLSFIVTYRVYQINNTLYFDMMMLMGLMFNWSVMDFSILVTS